MGETGLQLLRYGPGEARISGAARIDGILRGLGGLYAGAFTTAQRDAIAAGLRPYGLVILNTTTNQYEWNSGSDATPNWQPISPPISAGAIGTTQLADGSVTSAKIADGTIAAADIAANAVTLAKVAADVPVIPVGALIEWPWSSASIPAWALLPYGQLLTAAAYSVLQGLADTAGRPYGGSAGTNFNLPDYRGRVSVGKDDMGGTAANRITVAISGADGKTLGAVFGAEGITLTTAQLAAHNHGVSDAGHAHGVTDPQHSHNYWSASGNVVAGQPSGIDQFQRTDVRVLRTGNPSNDIIAAATGISVNSAGTGVSIQNAGSGSAHQNTQPSIVVNAFLRVL